MGKILDAFNRKVFTRDIPKTAQGRFSFLMKKEKGNTKAIADRLGVTQRTVQRWIKGDRKISEKVAPKLADEVTKDWQPRVRQRAEKEARATGLQVDTRATFGFRGSAGGGTSDDPRERLMLEYMPEDMVGDLFAAYRAGNEERMNELIAKGMGEEYFTDKGRRADGLEVDMTDIDYLDVEW